MILRTRNIRLALVMLAMASSACQAPPPQSSPIAPATAVMTGAPPSTATPAVKRTSTPTAIPPLMPYTIAGLRQRSFPATRISVGAPTSQTEIFRRHPISYSSDGLKITGTMQVPVKGKPPFPVIVMNHGFFNREDFHSGDGTDRAAEYLNKHGYLTLSSDYRSWGGSSIGPSLYYSGLVIDVANLVAGVGSIPEADAHRIGMWGHSMGGGASMKVLMLKTPVRAAVLYSTVSADDADILGRWGLGCIGDVMAGEQQLDCNSSDVVPLDLPQGVINAYYEASLDPDALKLTSPLYHLELLSVPVQIHYGTEDGKTSAGTPPEWSKKLFQAMEAAGKTAEIYGYEGERHSFNGDAWIAFMERCAHFFDRHVKNAGT